MGGCNECVEGATENEERDVDGEEVGFVHAVHEDKSVGPVQAVIVSVENEKVVGEGCQRTFSHPRASPTTTSTCF